MSTQFGLLLEDYRNIWNNRLLLAAGADSEQVLIEAIKRELNDENSHPRIRRSRYEKYYFATKRIIESSITDSNTY